MKSEERAWTLIGIVIAAAGLYIAYDQWISGSPSTAPSIANATASVERSEANEIDSLLKKISSSPEENDSNDWEYVGTNSFQNYFLKSSVDKVDQFKTAIVAISYYRKDSGNLFDNSVTGFTKMKIRFDCGYHFRIQDDKEVFMRTPLDKMIRYTIISAERYSMDGKIISYDTNAASIFGDDLAAIHLQALNEGVCTYS